MLRAARVSAPSALPLPPVIAKAATMAPGVRTDDTAQQWSLPVAPLFPRPAQAVRPVVSSVQTHGSPQQGQPAVSAAPKTPGPLEVKPPASCASAGVVMGIPWSPKPCLPAKFSLSTAAISALQHLLPRAVLPHSMTVQAKRQAVALVQGKAEASGSSGSAACTNAVSQGPVSTGNTGMPVPEQPCGERSQPALQGTARGQPQTPPTPAADSLLPGSPQASTPREPLNSPSSSRLNDQFATPPSTPPARSPPAAALPVSLESPAVDSSITMCVTAPATAQADAGHVPVAGLGASVDAASALVLASAATSALAALGVSTSAGSLPWPLYLIGTRDSFTYALHAEQTEVRGFEYLPSTWC